MMWAAVLTRGTPCFESVVWAAACHDLRMTDQILTMAFGPVHVIKSGNVVKIRSA